ncbi:MAG: tetratricopeptide repeat protein [Candidatus Omnitrophota bacterium]
MVYLFYRRISRFLSVFLFLSVVLWADNIILASDRQTAVALASYIMGGIYEREGETDLAVQEYKKALKADEKNSTVHLALSAVYIKKKQIPLAIEEINFAIKYEPEMVEPHAILALLYFSQDKILEAGNEYEIALQNAAKLEPQNISIFKSLGILYLQRKNFERAESTFKFIIGVSESDSEAHFYLANSLDEQKKRDAAVKELKSAINIKPDYHQALNYLGYLYVEENKNFTEAEKLIKKAVEIEPENGAYIDSLGWLFFKQGKIKEAIKELEKAVLLLEDPVIFDHLGDAYSKIKDFSTAKDNWEKSLKLEPNQVQVKKKIEDARGKDK